MKTITILAPALAGTLSLAACNKATEVPTTPASTSAMAGMDMSAAVKTGNGSGKITALDAAGGKITIAHGAIAAVGWPAMTMGFKVDPKLLGGISVGDHVDFALSLKGNDGTVTTIVRK